jgi:hypothetical protein
MRGIGCREGDARHAPGGDEAGVLTALTEAGTTDVNAPETHRDHLVLADLRGGRRGK